MGFRGRVLLVLLFAGILAVAAVVSIDLARQRDRVVRGTVVWDESAGGLDEMALAARLTVRSRKALARSLTVVAGEKTLRLTPAQAGIRLDTEETVRRALREGREDGPWGRLVHEVAFWRPSSQVEPVFSVAAPRWEPAVDALAVAVERLPVDAALALGKGDATVTPHQDGVALDREQLRAATLQALRAGASSVTAPLQTLAPAFTTDQAQTATKTALLACRQPVTLVYREARFTLQPDELATIAAVSPRGLAAGRPLTFDTPPGRDLLEKRLSGIVEPPLDARFTVRPDGSGFDIVPGKAGVVVDWDALFAAVDRVAFETGRRSVPVPTSQAQPRLSTAAAQQLRDRREVASFTTYFSPDDEARAKNIRQVAKLLNGTPIEPGSVFSFNQTVGPRTKAAGFDEAPVISGGRLIPGVGGGICQVSTTLFNAVFLAGLPVVERKNHSFFIDHYPIGRDATVSYGTTDFRFKNDSDQTLLILAAATERSVRVSLVAPRWERTVTYEAGRFTDIAPPASSRDNPRRVLDPALSAGTVSPVEEGIDGGRVEVRRIVKDGEGRVLIDDVFRSVYRPKDYLVRVGA